jgi:hypothetical protein
MHSSNEFFMGDEAAKVMGGGSMRLSHIDGSIDAAEAGAHGARL